jgi:hypothetical protein
MMCVLCDNPLDGIGYRIVAFHPDHPNDSEYYCTSVCFVRAYSVQPRKKFMGIF